MTYLASKINPITLQAMNKIQAILSSRQLSRLCSLVAYDFMAMLPPSEPTSAKTDALLIRQTSDAHFDFLYSLHAPNLSIAVKLTANHLYGDTKRGELHDACPPKINTEDRRNSQPMTSGPPLMRIDTADQLPATAGHIPMRRGRCEA